MMAFLTKIVELGVWGIILLVVLEVGAIFGGIGFIKGVVTQEQQINSVETENKCVVIVGNNGSKEICE